jgi:gamma-glutamyl:cysteine ligase YbdK (ATP-grasp superfamily)
LGDEITHSHFTDQDFRVFESRLETETRLLQDWFSSKHFSNKTPVCGLEVEAWLTDSQGLPVPKNEIFLDSLNHKMVVPELARFNVELNVEPQLLKDNALQALEQELTETWDACTRVASDMDCRIAMIGILPSVRQEDLSLTNMSDMKRYRALNDQVLKLRDGKPIQLDIHGHDHLNILHRDVMLESAATSLQIHLKVGQESAVRYYNASQIVSAPMVAASTNSPYLFGKDLWSETRIPLFEQAVEVGGFAGAARGPVRRVSFGTGYARQSLLECFTENQAHFPVLLPMEFDEPIEQLRHLRLHNGTIWRWNRPLIGFDDDGTPHLRIEHRVMPAGPTMHDSIANAAFYFGLVHALAVQDIAPEIQLPFSTARDNFYAAAQHGLDAQIIWLDGRKLSIQRLLLDQLIPMARYGLGLLGIDAQQRDLYLETMYKRVENACTGCDWQRAYVACHGGDMTALTRAYYERQQSGWAVHDWGI